MIVLKIGLHAIAIHSWSHVCDVCVSGESAEVLNRNSLQSWQSEATCE